MNETVGSRLTFTCLGVAIGFIIWIAQLWIVSSTSMYRTQEDAIRDLQSRVVKVETLLPEIRNTLEEIKVDVRRLLKP